jgi:flagellar motor switch protein FliG
LDLDASPGLSDLEKSAVVLLSIGEEAAAEVLKYMTQLEINQLSLAMARVSNVSKGEVTEIFAQFIDAMLDESSIGIGASGYVRGVLERALGSDKAERLIARLNQGDYFAGIEAVQMQDPRVLAEMIKNEHPQVVAMIFAYMEPEQADALIQFLPPELIEQVIPRLASLDSIPNAAVRELNEAIEDLLAGENAAEARINIGGVGMAAKLLNRFNAERVEGILNQISQVDQDLAQRLQNSLFTFEELVKLDDRNFQMLLRSIDQKLLASALKGAETTLLDKVMRNLSQRSAEMLREEISARGPMRVTEIDAAKREVVATAQRLEREGAIILSTDARDMVS